MLDIAKIKDHVHLYFEGILLNMAFSSLLHVLAANVTLLALETPRMRGPLGFLFGRVL